MKKQIALMLIMIILMSVLPSISLAAVPYSTTESDFPGFNKLSESEQIFKWDYATDSYKGYKVNLKQLINDAKVSGSLLKTANKMYACPLILAEYGLLVYDVEGHYLTTRGSGDVSTNGKAIKRAEYRYLGYSFTNDKVTNDLFQNDTGYSDPNKLKTKKWIVTDADRSSWGDSISDKKTDGIFNTAFISDDGTGTKNPLGLNIADILNPRLNALKNFTFTQAASMSKAAVDTARRFVRVQAIPTIASKGSVAMEHRSNGKTYYNTFILGKLDMEFEPKMTLTAFEDLACTKRISRVDLQPQELQRIIYIKANTDVNMSVLGLHGYEAQYIASVTNEFVNDNKKGTPLINFSNPSVMKTVFAYTIKRVGFTETKDTPVIFNGKATIMPVNALIDITKGLSAKTSIQVKLAVAPLAEGEIRPEFQIHYMDRNFTDDVITTKTEKIEKNFVFDLIDKSEKADNAKIVAWSWSILNVKSRNYEPFSLVQFPSYTLKPSEVDTYMENHKMTFKLEIKSEKGVRKNVTHTTRVEAEVPPDPEKPVPPRMPRVDLDAPKIIKAGEVSNLEAHAYIEEGYIKYFDYTLDKDTRVLNAGFSNKEVTFLNYGIKSKSEVLAVADNDESDQAQAITDVRHPLTAVMTIKGSYKVNRTVSLDSVGSTGTHYYPIDTVTWTILPMEGQPLEKIKYHTGKVGAKINVDFKQSGKYKVYMDVHSTCTYGGEQHRSASLQEYGEIVIYPDEPPVAKLSVPTKVVRDSQYFRKAKFIISDLSYTTDGDVIGAKRFYVRVDTNNDKNLNDESWQLIYSGLVDGINYETPLVGLYEFKIEVAEANESNGSPFYDPLTDTLKDDTASQPISEKMTEVVNVAPITSISADKRSVDVIIATDYIGTALSQLKTDVDMLTKDLYEEGINLQVSFVNSRVAIGMIKEPLYNFHRYLTVSATMTDKYDPKVTAPIVTSNVFKVPWEKRVQKTTDYLPNYGANIPVSSSVTQELLNPRSSDYVGSDPTAFYKYVVNAVSDPFLKKMDWNTWASAEDYSYAYSQFKEWYIRTVNSISFTLDGVFSKASINSYTNEPLYGIDLNAVKNTSFREGADRKVLFMPTRTDGLLKLDDTFKTWAVGNNIEISSVGISDLKDAFGYGKIVGAKFKPFKDGYSTAVYTTDMGNSYEVSPDLTYESNTTEIAPVRSTDKASSQRGLTIYPFNYYPPIIKLKDAAPVFMPAFSPYISGLVTKKGMYNYRTDDEYFTKVEFELRGRDLYEVTENKNSIVPPVGDLVMSNVTQYAQYGELPRKRTVYYGTPPGWGGPGYLEITETSQHALQGGTDHIVGYDYTKEYHWQLPVAIATFKNDYGKDSYGNPNGDPVFEPTLYRRFDGSYFVEKAVGLGYNYSLYSDNMSDYTFKKVELGKIFDASFIGSQISGKFIYMTGDQKCIRSIHDSFPTSNTAESMVYQMHYEPSDTIRSAHVIVENKLLNSDYHYCGITVLESGKTGGFGNGKNVNQTSMLPEDDSFEKRYYKYDRPDAYRNDDPATWRKDYAHLGHFGGFALKETRSIANANPVTLQELIQTTPTGKAYNTFEEFKNSLTALYKELSYSSTNLRLLGDTVENTVLYADYENDSLYDSQIAIAHDPNAFENPIGTDPNNGKTVKAWDGKLNKTGLYTLDPKVRDNPNEDDRFDDYRLWNKDKMTLNILVHRRPIAKMTAKVTNAYPFALTARDNISLDLDHESQANRGIVEVEWGLKKVSDDNWEIVKGTLGTGLNRTLVEGENYLVSYRVKDVEGEWSFPVIKELTAEISLQLEASLKSESTSQSLTKFQTGNNVVFHDLWTSYPLAHNLEIQMYDGTTPILNKVTLMREWGNVKTEAFPERDWNDVVFNIPKMVNGVKLEDKTYTFKVMAYDSVKPSVNKVKTFSVTTVGNTAPTVSFVSTTPSLPYEGDVIQSTIMPLDADGDLLKVEYYLWHESEQPKLIQTYNNQPSGVQKELPAFFAQKTGTYYQKVVVTDPSDATGEATKAIWVQAMRIDVSVLPNDPMAGDMLYFNVSTTGHVDKVEIIPDQTWITQDRRVAMGYKAAPYAAGIKSAESYKALLLEMDEAKLSDSKQYKYIVWVSVPQSVTLKKQRLRAPYNITVRAWKGSVFRDKVIVVDLEGSVLQTIKMGTPNK